MFKTKDMQSSLKQQDLDNNAFEEIVEVERLVKQLDTELMLHNLLVATGIVND